jgi:EmrB/QacA subfamily drug resistance transporter
MPATRSTPRLSFLALGAAGTAYSMLQSLVSPVLPTLSKDLHSSQSSITWVFTAWLLAASVATPLFGRLGDLIGKRRTLVASLGAVALGCLVSAIAPNLAVLLAGRVLQGLGGAVVAVSFGIVRDEFPPHRVPSAVGALSAVIAFGGGLGVVLAGPIVAGLGWRWLFWIPLIGVGAAVVLVQLTVPESPHRAPGRINPASSVLLTAWLVALLIPLSEAPAWGWAAPTSIMLFIAAAVLFAAWVVVELRAASPLVDLRMMRIPAVWTTNLAGLAIGASMFSILAFVPEFTQTPPSAGYGFGASVTGAGLLLLPLLLGMTLTGSLSGPLAGRFPVKAQLVWGSALCALSFAALAAFHAAAWQAAAAGAAYGIGLGFAYAAMTGLVVQSVPAHQTGVAAGTNANIRTIGGSIGTAAVGSLITAHTLPGGVPTESGFTHGFVVLAIVSAAAVVGALLVPGRRPASTLVASSEDYAQTGPADAELPLPQPHIAVVAAATADADAEAAAAALRAA